jgi:hypothetical protein
LKGFSQFAAGQRNSASKLKLTGDSLMSQETLFLAKHRQNCLNPQIASLAATLLRKHLLLDAEEKTPRLLTHLEK